MKINRRDLLTIFLAVFSLVAAWQVDAVLPQQIIVAPLYLIPILIITSRFKTKFGIICAVCAIALLTTEQILENQNYFTIIFDNIGIAIVSYLAIRLNFQRNNAERLKEDSEKTKKQLEVLMHVVSHDIKQPITVASLIALSLSKTTKGNNLLLVKKLRDAVESITMLTSDLGDTARLAGGQLTLNKQDFDLSQFLTDIVSEEQLITAKHKIVINTHAGITGSWDRARLKRVFVNLISNAIKYSPDGGRIHVQVKKNHRFATVAVKDSGIGMTKKESDSLFQPFVRQYKGKKKIQGTGLGLYICRSLINAHNGKIWVTSRKGKGSTFNVELPLR